MQDLVPWSGIEPRSPELVAQSLSHWTTREVPRNRSGEPRWKPQRVTNMNYYIVFTATIPAFGTSSLCFILFVLLSFPFQLQGVPTDFQKHTFFFLGLKWSKTLQSLCLPPTSRSSACLYSVGNFSQRISLFREMRTGRNKWNQIINVVVKHSQGLSVPSQGLQIIFWATACELSYTESPTRWRS